MDRSRLGDSAFLLLSALLLWILRSTMLQKTSSLAGKASSSALFELVLDFDSPTTSALLLQPYYFDNEDLLIG